jgi:hypothetical protein
MRKKLLFLLAVSAVLTCQTLKAQNTGAPDQNWMAAITPGPFHQKLAQLQGDFTSETTVWMMPDNPMKASGDCTNKMIMSGRYLESKYNGNMMGMPFEGLGTLGYDNISKSFVNTWIDNLGTGIMVLTGKMTSDDVLELKGQITDPMSGKVQSIRQTLKWVDATHHTIEMFADINGKEMKTMEIKLTKK